MNSRAALAYAIRMGWLVLPLLVRRKEPNGMLAPHGVDDASCDPRVITEWWRAAPDGCIGIACAASGFVTLDIDPRNGGDETIARLIEKHGPLPKTPVQFTGGGGQHFLFAVPHGVSLRGSVGRGLDLKAKGYIVGAPSIHPNGERYRWDTRAHPLFTELAPMPGWLLELARQRPPQPIAKIDLPSTDRVERARKYLASVPGAVSGQGGHSHTFLTAQKLVRGFLLDEGEAFALLAEWNRTCSPPWSSPELARKIKQAIAHGQMPEGALLEKRRAS